MMKRIIVPLACASILAGPGVALAADHIDSPQTINDPAADITDLYAFMNPNDANELVLVADVNPFATSATRFSDAVLYTFHLTNGAGTGNEIQCTFDTPDETTLDQTVTCTGPGNRTVSGPIGQVNTNSDFRVFAGVRDDPFFFDEEAFLNTVQSGSPQFTDPGTDFFAGLNVASIVVGIDVSAISQGSGEARFTQSVWLSTERTGGAGIGPGFSGAWYDPGQEGQGFSFEVLDQQPAASESDDPEDLLVYWFHYLNGQQVWLYGRGSIDGDSATVPMYVTSGGQFGPGFDASQVDQQRVGTLTVNGMSCDDAEVSFESTSGDFPGIDFPIQRLSKIKNLSCRFLAAGNIDRMGRPAVSTALIPAGDKDRYNSAHAPAQWPSFEGEIQASLEFVDGLDGEQGNALLGDSAALAGVLADDRLVIDTSVPNCGPYLAVELTPQGETPSACGGRTLSRDVIDDTLSALVGVPVGDGVDANDRQFLPGFPFLATAN